MGEVYVALIGLAGVVIGAGGSLLGMLIQSRRQERQERAKLALHTAMEAYKVHISIGKGKRLMPFASYAFWHSKVLELVERDALTPNNIAALREQQKRLDTVFEEPGEH